MKIQILGSPRSGTTCLYQALRDNINYSTGIFEPLSPGCNYRINNPKEVKSHISIINNYKGHIIEKNIFDIDECNLKTGQFFKNYLKNFNKIIFLVRKNQNQQCQSLQISSITRNWHKPYKNIEVDYKELLPLIESKNKLILELSNELKSKIFFYEDLYSNNINYLDKLLNYCNIELDNKYHFYDMMNTKNRLKQL
tara:strand:+ start:2926 stop:3513 length:588 start_codon:yes stop_codon:yes gene_type:complete